MELEILNQLILNTKTIEIVVLNDNFVFVDVNNALLEIARLKREEILGQPANFLWDEQSYQQLKQDLVRDRTFSGLLYENTIGGRRRLVHYTVSKVIEPSAHFKGYTGFGQRIQGTETYENELQKRLDQVHSIQLAAMVSLAKLAETRDPETGQHLERMSHFSRALALELSQLREYKLYITEDYVQDIFLSSPLHDIGKVGIRDEILLKPGKLTPQEFDDMKRHSVIGGDALSAADERLKDQSFLTLGKEIAYHHHEKWDGSGYPYGLKREEIPLSARIVAIADVYDALTSKRVYKEAMPHDKAKKIIEEGTGSHFDPNLVTAFLKKEKEFLEIRNMYSDLVLVESGVR